MRKNVVKWMVAAVLIAGIAGVYIAYNQWNKEHADASDVAGIKVSAQELLKAYQTNEQDANAKFVGKVVEVSGEIAEISGDTLPKIIVAVPDEIMEGIVISIDKRYTSDVANLKAGDKAVFKGFCSGYLQLSGVIVNDAVVVK
jgi:hypothetical protein